ncbi:MAG: efflux RND transporter permease subunit [Bacteroidales bacterium]|nr:efflux RND transporter permease subunit [Candidatus Scybalocola fimicaballi]
MSIFKTAIDKPITTSLIFIAVMVLGIFSFKKLPIDQFPEMEPPFVCVMTAYPGANASEVETNVTKVMENTLNSVDGLKTLTSTSKDNISLVAMEFEWGSELDEAVNDIRSFVDMVKDNLPDGTSTPLVIKFSTSSMPIIQYMIQAKESYPGLEKYLNDVVVPQLNHVDQIGNITLSGEPERRIYVDIDQNQLDAYAISLEQVGQAVAGNNLNLSSGTVKMNKEQYALEVRSEYAESKEIENIVVTTTADGKTIYIRDIATVKDTIKDLTLEEKVNGQDAVRLIVTKQTGGNTVQICTDVKKEVEKIKKVLPKDVQFNLLYDSSRDIVNAINSLEESIMYALVFVVLVVLFFLGKWRAAIIVGITIPISLLVSFIYLLGADSSINIISLCSLTIAVGMVVDDAIVVLENISTHIQRGSSPREASIYATNEVWVSVIATTLVICAVFVPLTMVTGIAGILFKELGWIVTISCCTSTAVAISLTPMLCSKLLKNKPVHIENGKLIEEEVKDNWYQRTVVRALDKVDAFYANVLRWCLTHKKFTMLGAVAFFVISLIPMMTGMIGTNFISNQDNGRVVVNVELQQGNRVEETAKIARKIEHDFEAAFPEEIRLINTTCGSNDEAGLGALFTSTTNNKIQMRVICTRKAERSVTIDEIAEKLRQILNKYPEIITYKAENQGGFGGQGGQTVDIEIYGYEFDATSQYAYSLKDQIEKNVAGARDVDISREKDRPELKIIVDKEKASKLGLSSATISSYVRNRVNGMNAGLLKEDGDEYDILVRLKEENRNSLSLINDLSIPTMMGRVKLSEIAKVEEFWSPPQIERKSRQRCLTMKITPFNTSLGELAVEIQKLVDKSEIPAGCSVMLSGAYEDQQESFADMGMLLALIVFLVYVVMASQFESLAKPFMIMMAVPFAISGTIIALLVTNTYLDMIGMLGIIMLVGIVVKNGIVLVDYIDLMRDRGYELNEAIALSGQSRLRPVLMTAATTVLGMIPMTLSKAEGSEMWVSMGIVVIGGICVSTLVTLIVVPVLYGIMSRHGERDLQKEVRNQFIFMDIDVNKDEIAGPNTKPVKGSVKRGEGGFSDEDEPVRIG